LSSRAANGAAPRLVNVGHGNVVLAHQIVAIVALDSLPVKRLIESAKGSTKSHHLILSSLEPATLAQRLATDRSGNGD
jgi:extracellular matrix regulatory protein A